MAANRKEQPVWNRLAAFFAAVMLALAGTLAVASPAQAAACSSGYICFYDSYDRNNLMVSWPVATWPDGVCYNLPSSAQNRTSSIDESGGRRFIVYSGTCANPGSQEVVYEWAWGNMNSFWNNTIVGVKKCNNNTCQVT